MEKFESLHEIHETDYDVMVANSWAEGYCSPVAETPVSEPVAQHCCASICISCDERYLYI